MALKWLIKSVSVAGVVAVGDGSWPCKCEQIKGTNMQEKESKIHIWTKATKTNHANCTAGVGVALWQGWRCSQLFFRILICIYDLVFQLWFSALATLWSHIRLLGMKLCLNTAARIMEYRYRYECSCGLCVLSHKLKSNMSTKKWHVNSNNSS